MRNKYNWVIEGSAPPPPEVLGIGESDRLIQVQFVMPTAKKPEDQPPPPIDVTPQGPPDYSRPALEPPRPRERTPFGAVFEQPKGTDWVK